MYSGVWLSVWDSIPVFPPVMKIVSVRKWAYQWTNKDMLRTQSTALSTKNFLPISSETDIRKKKMAWMNIFQVVFVWARRCHNCRRTDNCDKRIKFCSLKFADCATVGFILFLVDRLEGFENTSRTEAITLPVQNSAVQEMKKCASFTIHNLISSTPNACVRLVNFVMSLNFKL